MTICQRVWRVGCLSSALKDDDHSIASLDPLSEDRYTVTLGGPRTFSSYDSHTLYAERDPRECLCDRYVVASRYVVSYIIHARAREFGGQDAALRQEGLEQEDQEGREGWQIALRRGQVHPEGSIGHVSVFIPPDRRRLSRREIEETLVCDADTHVSLSYGTNVKTYIFTVAKIQSSEPFNYRTVILDDYRWNLTD